MSWRLLLTGAAALLCLAFAPPPVAMPGPDSDSAGSTASSAATETSRCVAFSPYVAPYDPEYGPHPSPATVDALLANVLRQTSANCIMTYSVLDRSVDVLEAARKRSVKVIAIVWLDADAAANRDSIAAGIARARAYPGTIVRLACGSEVRTRHGAAAAAPIIRDCLGQLRAAAITQPVGSIDSWWGWCDEAWPCRSWNLAGDLDWIGVNIYPWWENKHSGIFPCTPAAQAAAFTVSRYQAMIATYPAKDVLLTEFGWPAGPEGHSEPNAYTGERCGVAGQANQRLVIAETVAALDRAGLSGVVFEAYREPFKARYEGVIGPYWGICESAAPYACPGAAGLLARMFLPLVRTR